MWKRSWEQSGGAARRCLSTLESRNQLGGYISISVACQSQWIRCRLPEKKLLSTETQDFWFFAAALVQPVSWTLTFYGVSFNNWLIVDFSVCSQWSSEASDTTTISGCVSIFNASVFHWKLEKERTPGGRWWRGGGPGHGGLWCMSTDVTFRVTWPVQNRALWLAGGGEGIWAQFGWKSSFNVSFSTISRLKSSWSGFWFSLDLHLLTCTEWSSRSTSQNPSTELHGTTGLYCGTVNSWSPCWGQWNVAAACEEPLVVKALWEATRWHSISKIYFQLYLAAVCKLFRTDIFLFKTNPDFLWISERSGTTVNLTGAKQWWHTDEEVNSRLFGPHDATAVGVTASHVLHTGGRVGCFSSAFSLLGL